ncbi:MAG: hypothetical protein PHI32_12065 [Dysgonamonadaceae bacterium]|nr:hypothetical protein [Dysgonamonadaceae bacterium]MDD4293567.1 hypothetical protein [Bacteroidales bacterium]
MKKVICLVLVGLFVFGVSGCKNTEKSRSPDPIVVSISGEVLLPFAKNNKLIWQSSEITNSYVEYKQEHKENEVRIANISKTENAQNFINIINNTNKTLIGTSKQSTTGDNTKPFPGLDSSSEIYFFRTASGDMMSEYKTKNWGYFWFRIMQDKFYHYSLYKVDLNDLQKTDRFFEGLDKKWESLMDKPVLYLYPQHETDVNVKLGFLGRLTTTYPAYNDGWNVHVYPDGLLVNNADKQEYNYLFWEGVANNPNWDLSEGYCVSGADTVSFLQKKLNKLGLTPKEYNDFIVYWLPRMENNPYNLITFQWREYEKIAPLAITPTPDSVLRVFMAFAPLDKPINIKAPGERNFFVRTGFSVVEWGGTEISYK